MPEPAPASDGAPGPRLARVGVVAIGRNEGERLRRCFESLPVGLGQVVYVDSGSTDASVAEARRRGIDVVQLDLSIPFTAARARNAGLARLRERAPGLAFVQLVDGDCVLQPGWIEAALDALQGDARVAVVCGRRRELRAEASIYNRLCDMEWDTPVGDVLSCGGDALMRIEALRAVGGYDERLIGGEEPELCARLRARGGIVRRIAREMTLHDAGMTRLSQWWRRSVRAGYGFAEVGSIHDLFGRARWSGLAWACGLPAAALALAVPTRGLSLALLLAYPASWLRIVVRRRAGGQGLADAALYATFCLLGKFPEAQGAIRYWWNRARARRATLIEYK